MRSFALGLLGCGMMMSPFAAAQEARLHISADSVFVGERFELRIAVEHTVGSTVVFQEVPNGDPEAGSLLSFGDAEVFSAQRLPPRLDGTVRVDSIVYEATTFALDNAVIGPVMVELIAGGDTSIVRSNTVTLPVRSVLPTGEADLQPPGPPASFPSPLWIWVLLAVGVLVIASLLIWLWWRSRDRETSTRPYLAPYPEATQRLHALAIPETNATIKPFYVELSDLLRTYLSRTLGVPALELTTLELINALASDVRVPEEALKGIRGTLRAADLVKFADMRPNSEAHAATIEEASEAVGVIEAVVHPPVYKDGEQKVEDGEHGKEVSDSENGKLRTEDGFQESGIRNQEAKDR